MDFVFAVIKIFGGFYAWMFAMMYILWPINDKPTSKGQYVVAIITSLIFIIAAVKLI